MTKLKFGVGDKVKVRSWDSLVKEFGVDGFGDITLSNNYFLGQMREYCGKTLVISEKRTKSYKTVGNTWNWTDEMFEPKPIHNTIVIYIKDNQVIALDKATGKTGVAICSPDDEFDFYVGADLAYNRLRGREKPAKEKGPKYYNGEIICISTDASNLTIGRIYKVKNGQFRDDSGSVHGCIYPYVSFNDLNNQHLSEFVEVVR